MLLGTYMLCIIFDLHPPILTLFLDIKIERRTSVILFFFRPFDPLFSGTRLVDLLDFRQFFKAFGNN